MKRERKTLKRDGCRRIFMTSHMTLSVSPISYPGLLIRDGEEMLMLITLVPKVLYTWSLIHWLKSLGLKFNMIKSFQCLKFYTNNFNLSSVVLSLSTILLIEYSSWIKSVSLMSFNFLKSANKFKFVHKDSSVLFRKALLWFYTVYGD